MTTFLVARAGRRAQQSATTGKRGSSPGSLLAHWPQPLRNFGASFIGAVIGPFTDFFARYGLRVAVFALHADRHLRSTEFTMGSMANPFYIDHGYSLDRSRPTEGVGLPVSMAGVIAAGVHHRQGRARAFALFLGSILIALSNIGFALLATTEAPLLLGARPRQSPSTCSRRACTARR